jgi:Xaa-Pro aminopeptidase
LNAPSKEAVGAAYSIDSMRHAQAMTWRAIEQLSQQIRPGILESQARELGKQVLADLDMQRIWHPLLVRFGANTLKTFKQRSDGDPALAENDIFFIDMGAVWQGHEGDAGATFTTGSDPQMAACASAAKALFERVQLRWKTEKVVGLELYRYAQEQARDMGWELNLSIKGHRVSDFPHAIHRGGDLGDFEHYPNEGLWILEIQIAHPSKAYGAFYEDLLA